jgi:hypothetical protein
MVPKMTPVSVEETWRTVSKLLLQVVAESYNLDSSFDTLEAARRNCVNGWPLHNLQVTKYSKVKAKVLQCVGCLVDEQNI